MKKSYPILQSLFTWVGVILMFSLVPIVIFWHSRYGFNLPPAMRTHPYHSVKPDVDLSGEAHGEYLITDTFVSSNEMSHADISFWTNADGITSTPLLDGQFMVINSGGGSYIFDENNGKLCQFTKTTEQHYCSKLKLLQNGYVILWGGFIPYNERDDSGKILSSERASDLIELYDPAKRSWQSLSGEPRSHLGGNIAITADQKIYLVGGSPIADYSNSPSGNQGMDVRLPEFGSWVHLKMASCPSNIDYITNYSKNIEKTENTQQKIEKFFESYPIDDDLILWGRSGPVSNYDQDTKLLSPVILHTKSGTTEKTQSPSWEGHVGYILPITNHQFIKIDKTEYREQPTEYTSVEKADGSRIKAKRGRAMNGSIASLHDDLSDEKGHPIQGLPIYNEVKPLVCYDDDSGCYFTFGPGPMTGGNPSSSALWRLDFASLTAEPIGEYGAYQRIGSLWIGADGNLRALVFKKGVKYDTVLWKWVKKTKMLEEIPLK